MYAVRGRVRANKSKRGFWVARADMSMLPVLGLSAYHDLRSAEQRYRSLQRARRTHRDQALVPGDAEHGVVALGPSAGGVDEHVHVLVELGLGGRLREHDVQVRAAEQLLAGAEGQPAQLRLDQVRPVLRGEHGAWVTSQGASRQKTGADSHLHHRFELDVPVGALPPAREEEECREVRLEVREACTEGLPGHEVQLVHAVGGLAGVDAGPAGELDA